MPRVLLIANCSAGRGRAMPLLEAAQSRCVREGFAVEAACTTSAGHATELARASAAERIGVIGGDGTLREVVRGLGDRCGRVQVALIPAGHGNVVARERDLPLDDPPRALSALTGSREVAMDVGLANGEVFLAMAGAGFDTFPTRFVSAARETALGRSVYGRAWGGDLLFGLGGLLGLMRIPPARFALEVDGVALPRTYPSIIVCNTRTYAKGWSIAPDADSTDGELDYAAMRSASPVAMARVLRAARDRRSVSSIDYGRGRALAIAATRPFHWQVDGDSRPPAPSLAITLAPYRLRLLAPP